jgi:hypothetical protein
MSASDGKKIISRSFFMLMDLTQETRCVEDLYLNTCATQSTPVSGCQTLSYAAPTFKFGHPCNIGSIGGMIDE